MMSMMDRVEALMLLVNSVRTTTICFTTLVLGALKKILKITLLKI